MPKVVVADEPVSALDVSVQAAVTELLMDIQRENKTTMLFISHDLSVVRYIADRVVVMYLGYIVEQGTTDQIFSPPYHPYTEALLSAIPIADTSVVKKHIVLEGDIPSAMNPPPGCPFQTRCRYKKLVPGNLCETEVPPVKDLGDGHKSLCWLDDDVLAKMEPVISFGPDADGGAGQRTARKRTGLCRNATATAGRQARKSGGRSACRSSRGSRGGRRSQTRGTARQGGIRRQGFDPGIRTAEPDACGRRTTSRRPGCAHGFRGRPGRSGKGGTQRQTQEAARLIVDRPSRGEL